MTSTQLPGVERRLKKNAAQAAYRARKKAEANGDNGGFAPGVVEHIAAEAAKPARSKASGKARKAPAAKPERKARAPKAAAKPKAERTSRVDACLRLLSRAKGASVPEIMEEFGWLPHTTRAFISATLGKKLGHKIESEKDEKRGRVYRVAA